MILCQITAHFINIRHPNKSDPFEFKKAYKNLIPDTLLNKLEQAGFNFYSKANFDIRTEQNGEVFLQELYFNKFLGEVTNEVKLTNEDIQILGKAFGQSFPQSNPTSSTAKSHQDQESKTSKPQKKSFIHDIDNIPKNITPGDVYVVKGAKAGEYIFHIQTPDNQSVEQKCFFEHKNDMIRMQWNEQRADKKPTMVFFNKPPHNKSFDMSIAVESFLNGSDNIPSGNYTLLGSNSNKSFSIIKEDPDQSVDNTFRM